MMRFLLFILLALPAMGGREFVAASSHIGSASIAEIAPPLTVSACVYPTSDALNAVAVSLDTSTNSTERIQIQLNGAVAGDPIFLTLVNDAGSQVQTNSPSAYSTTSWTHVAAVVSSSTSRTLYVNGSGVNDSASSSVSGLNRVVIGARKNSSYGLFFQGRVAEVAVWDVALTASEVSSLSSGASPLLIRPANLKFYSPLSNRETSTEVNYVGAAISLTNAPAASALHPRIYKP